LHDDDAVLDASIAANRESGLPAIDVSPPLGKLLYLLARIQGARRILEIGTLGGYSSIWLARALPEGGRLTTLEANERHAAAARANLRRAADVVGIRAFFTGVARNPRLSGTAIQTVGSKGYDGFAIVLVS
jgi:predicted O-methyltransferase YrrM